MAYHYAFMMVAKVWELKTFSEAAKDPRVGSGKAVNAEDHTTFCGEEPAYRGKQPTRARTQAQRVSLFKKCNIYKK